MTIDDRQQPGPRADEAPGPAGARWDLTALRVVGGFIDRRIGWHRIGVLFSLTIVGIAAFALYHMLHDINLSAVGDAIVATNPRHVAMAAAFVVCGYFTLTFYDYFALRTIGRSEVPYRIAALAGFTSYSVGHNVGASALTGGAVRYRIYSARGLDAIEVAKICFVAGLTFWMGNVAVLGLGIFYEPEAASAINQLPAWINRSFAAAALVGLCLYVTWVWLKPRVIGRHGWRVTLPAGPLTLVQILIGILDLTFCAAAMYMLIPDQPYIDFIALGVIFVSATMLGFASHAPGGIGVFDAAMLLALWEFDKEPLLAGLLLFRLLYYVIPFAISLLILGIRELGLSIAASRRRREERARSL